MTLTDLRRAFSAGTTIYLARRFEENGIYRVERFEMDNYYWGNRELAEMEVTDFEATGEKEITAFTYMPMIVFRAWEQYGVDCYNNSRND